MVPIVENPQSPLLDGACDSLCVRAIFAGEREYGVEFEF